MITMERARQRARTPNEAASLNESSQVPPAATERSIDRPRSRSAADGSRVAHVTHVREREAQIGTSNNAVNTTLPLLRESNIEVCLLRQQLQIVPWRLLNILFINDYVSIRPKIKQIRISRTSATPSLGRLHTLSRPSSLSANS